VSGYGLSVATSANQRPAVRNTGRAGMDISAEIKYSSSGFPEAHASPQSLNHDAKETATAAA